MYIKDTFQPARTRISLEFFPPIDQAGLDKLTKTITILSQLDPAHISVTYGAGGTTRHRTQTTIEAIMAEHELTVVSHLTCVGADRTEMHEVVQALADTGVKNLLALRGDAPKGHPDWQPTGDHFQHAADLVTFLRQEFPGMGIGVAGFPEGHPETPNRMLEMEYLKAKVDAGADYIVTQLFFDNRDFFDFRERCEAAGINIPIVAGILPVTTKKMLRRLSELAAGSRIPASFSRWLERLDKDESVLRFGAHWAAGQIRELVDQETAGIHLYTLNLSDHCLQIINALGIESFNQL